MFMKMKYYSLCKLWGRFSFVPMIAPMLLWPNLLTHQQPSFDIKPLYNREQTVRRVNIFETRQQFAENITMITIEIAIGVSYSACVRKWVLWVRRDCPV